MRVPPPPIVKPKPLKCPEVLNVNNYAIPQSNQFWESFPFNPIPTSPKTCVDIAVLEKRVQMVSSKMSWAQLYRAKRCINSLKNGANSYQMSSLPPCFCKNSKSTLTYGKEVTDTVASWVKQGFVCGPFDSPPLDNFRVNPLMAVDQDEKVRLVMNVSLPEGKSLNDNVNVSAMEKVHMSSAREVSYVIHEAGRGAWMSKMDKKDAYKIIPAPLPDIRLQGFQWLNKFFAETQQIFGAEPSVCNYDILGKTVQTITILECDVSERSSPRQLDDTIKVDPKNSEKCKIFTEKYIELCGELGIQLAENCKNFEKAFTNSHYGKILGILFDTTNLTWRLPDEKIYKTLHAISEALTTEKITLIQMQKLLGRLNDVSLMCTFLKGFKRSLNDDLGLAQRTGCAITLSERSKKDLMIWVGFLHDKNPWNPISPRPSGPPVFRKEFSSDSAGGSTFNGRIGCGSVGFSESGEIIFAAQLFWPENGLIIKLDQKGAKFANKTTTLEMIGVILPFLLIPDQLAGQHIVLKVDNIACIFGWENRSVAGDRCASVLIRCLHLISSYLGSVIHMQHLPRVSSWDAELTDRLSRERTTTLNDRKLLNAFSNRPLPRCFSKWLDSPTEDFSLCDEVLSEIESLCRLVT